MMKVNAAPPCHFLRYGLYVMLSALLFLPALPLCGDNEPSLLPQSFLKGWAVEGKIERYTPDNLYSHIDGEAEMYVPFGFQVLETAFYVNVGDADAGLTADVYRMGSLLDAFGIYSYYRDPEAEDPRVGTESFVDESQLMFYKDRYFVRLSVSGAKSTERAVLVACAKAVAGAIPGSLSQPKELEFLRIPEIIPRTEKYAALSVMGYAFFKKGLTADASLGGRPAKVFVILDESERASGRSVETYVGYLKEKGMKPEITEGKEGFTLASQDPLYKGVLVRQAGPYLLGVAGLADPRAGTGVIERMQSRVPKP